MIDLTWPAIWPFFVLSALAWRVTSLLVKERGPYDIFGRLRDRFVSYDEFSRCQSRITEVFCCVWCMSIWVCGILSVMAYGVEGLIWALPMSTLVLLLERQIR